MTVLALRPRLLRLLLPLLVMVFTAISGNALAGPKPASGQFLPAATLIGAEPLQDATSHQAVWKIAPKPAAACCVAASEAIPEVVVNATGGGSAGQLAINRAAGAAFEQSVGADLAQSDLSVGQQLTVKTQSGVRTRLDFLTQDPMTGEIGCIECKASPTAPLTDNQAAAFPEIGQTGGTILGAGKPGFPGGMQLPPTTVQIIRGQ